MIKFDDFVAAVLRRGAGWDAPYLVSTLRVAVEELGFHVGEDGYIHDPRPAPSTYPEQRNVHWRGQQRRRGRR